MAKPRPKGVTRGRRFVISFFSASMTLLAVLVVAGLVALFIYHGPGPAADNGAATTTVILRPGAGLSEISTALERAHVVRSGAVFAASAELTRAAHSLKAGEYEFPSRASMARVLDKIHKGLVVRHFVTIPEGVTAEMAVDILMAHPELSGAAPVPPEGSILPETYDVRRGEDRGVVLNQMMSARDKLLDALWAQRTPGLPLKSPAEAVILASIVEKETAKANERPMIARVFVNRLNKGMPLQTDPTVIYGISRGRPLGRGLTSKELVTPTPYNTYVIPGLPPTPIANPSREALAAVMSPPDGDWLYFVADGTGGHAFASTLEAHNANVARWLKLERARAGQAEPSADTADNKPAAKSKTSAKAKHGTH
jgi:UPF0755 protein